MNKLKILIIYSFVFSLLIVNLFSAQNTITIMINNTEVEQGVLDYLNEFEFVPIIVEIYPANVSLVNSLLSNLSESEFKLKETLLGGEGFAGNITKEGFDKLINSQDVRLIYLNKDWHVLKNEMRDRNNLNKIFNSDNQGIIISVLIILLIIVFYIIFHKKRQ